MPLLHPIPTSLKCRFGCDGPAAIVHTPEGCVCWPDPVQALCPQHLATIESTGPVNVIVALGWPLIDNTKGV